jgi:hypothetical protein
MDVLHPALERGYLIFLHSSPYNEGKRVHQQKHNNNVVHLACAKGSCGRNT